MRRLEGKEQEIVQCVGGGNDAPAYVISRCYFLAY